MSIPIATGFFSSAAGALAACVVFGLLLGLAVLLAVTRRTDVSRRVSEFVSTGAAPELDAHSLVERALGDKQSRSIARSPFLAQLRVDLDVAEVPVGLDQILAAVVVVTLLVGWLLMTETGSVIAAPLAFLVPAGAHYGLRIKADRQRRAFSEQLPDNLQVIASAMRAGQTFVGSLQAVVDDAPEPSSKELRRAVTDEALGVPLQDALERVTERMKSEDFQHVAIVAGLQRDTGGNTAEVVDLVADTIRGRLEIRRLVRGLTAQGRLAGFVLSGLPMGLLLIISLVNPSYAHPLFHTTPGLVALGVAVGLMGAGSYIIRRIINITV
jgi:tight adherence protein B